MAARGFISHIDLNVAHPAASVHFYELVLGHLGFQHHPVEEGRSRWSLDYPDGARCEIEVRPPAGAAKSVRDERYSPGIDHLAFHAESRSDVDALHGKLVAAGYKVAEPPREYDRHPGTTPLRSTTRLASGSRLSTTRQPTHSPWCRRGRHSTPGANRIRWAGQPANLHRGSGVTVADLHASHDYVTSRCWDPDRTKVEVLWEAS